MSYNTSNVIQVVQSDMNAQMQQDAIEAFEDAMSRSDTNSVSKQKIKR